MKRLSIHLGCFCTAVAGANAEVSDYLTVLRQAVALAPPFAVVIFQCIAREVGYFTHHTHREAICCAIT